MKVFLFAIAEFPPILHVIRIGLATIAEWLLYKLLELLSWGSNHQLIVNLVITVAGILFFLYLLRLILKELRDFYNWINEWRKGDNSNNSNNILQ